jgi:hypothetical protein
LWFNRRPRWRAVLRVQKRRKQTAKINNNNETLHRRKGWKIKQRDRKSRFGFEFGIGFVAHTDMPHASCVQNWRSRNFASLLRNRQTEDLR